MIGHNLLTIYSPAKTQDVLFESLHEGIRLLWRAYVYAEDAQTTLWDFAVEIDRLYASGLTTCDLRWLVAKGFVQHGSEESDYGAPHRHFSPSEGYCFDQSTAMILTKSGVAFSKNLLAGLPSAVGSISVVDEEDDATPSTLLALTPTWNAQRRELSLGDDVVKRFRVPARNQELILSAFEEEAWPECIYDPLPSCADINPRTRLHDAINRLNGCQSQPLIRFHGNGNGEGIAWSLRVPV